MIEFKGTPGSWGIDADGIKAGDENGFQPFGGCGCCGSPWMSGDTEQRQQADANLIVSAPDLLALLIEAKAWIAGSSESAPSLCKDIDAAIAKALGTP